MKTFQTLSIVLLTVTSLFFSTGVEAQEKDTNSKLPTGINLLLFLGDDALATEENLLKAADRLIAEEGKAQAVELPSGLGLDFKSLGEKLQEKGLIVSVVGALAPDEDPDTPDPDISSRDPKERAAGLAAAKDQIDIAAKAKGKQPGIVLGGPWHICWKGEMKDKDGKPLVGALQAEERAKRSPFLVSSLKVLGDYAAPKGVFLAVEYLNHWEDDELVRIGRTNNIIIDKLDHPHVGVLVDFSHETISGRGPVVYAKAIARLLKAKKLFLVHSSAPHREGVEQSWLNWELLLTPILQFEELEIIPGMKIVISVEIFNKVLPFAGGARMHGRPYKNPFNVAAKSMKWTREMVVKYSKN